ncbi:MAG: hypothetical protein ABR568_15335 [Pyrinomonadaceae bacterium]
MGTCSHIYRSGGLSPAADGWRPARRGENNVVRDKGQDPVLDIPIVERQTGRHD